MPLMSGPSGKNLWTRTDSFRRSEDLVLDERSHQPRVVRASNVDLEYTLLLCSCLLGLTTKIDSISSFFGDAELLEHISDVETHPGAIMAAKVGHSVLTRSRTQKALADPRITKS